MTIATEAIDRLHTTATSHHRIIVCEIMGHSAGWLALGAGIAGGADVILIPEIAYDLQIVARQLIERRQHGKRFSIIAVAEGALSQTEAARRGQPEKSIKREKRDRAEPAATSSDRLRLVQESKASCIARQLQQLTGVEARVTSLGHVQRGGQPTPFDRLLCTRMGTAAGELLAHGKYNVMVALQGDRCVPVPLQKVAGRKKTVPPDHPWVETARLVATCMGDV
jgi:6-phosphofructokinase 1